ncbi:MAG: homocysteine S-methyltransferase [Microbacteriaceae bacterium]|nr:homocysteine S-methyltransferase [Microbacteriaceae bacterium]
MHLIDGGLSTELENLGARIEGELWTGRTLIAQPELVHKAHRNFVAAGAEIVITSSYQISRQGFREIGLSDVDADRALTKSVAVARSATAGTECQVAASVGPFGAVLHDGSEYRGDYKVSQSELEDFHFERLEVLLEAKPDLLAVETIPNVLEAKALAQVLSKVDIPFWVSFTAATEEKLWSGEYVADAAEAVAGLSNLIAVGLNCVDPEIVLDGVKIINSVTGSPAIAYPNCGGIWDAAKDAWVGGSRKSLVDWLALWRDSPIEYLGGCCGTDAKEIAKLHKALEELG